MSSNLTGRNRPWGFRKRGHRNFDIFEWIQAELNVFEPYGETSTMEIQKTRSSQFRHFWMNSARTHVFEPPSRGKIDHGDSENEVIAISTFVCMNSARRQAYRTLRGKIDRGDSENEFIAISTFVLNSARIQGYRTYIAISTFFWMNSTRIQAYRTLRGNRRGDSENEFIAISMFCPTPRGKSTMEIQKTRLSKFRRFCWMNSVRIQGIEHYGGKRPWRFKKNEVIAISTFFWMNSAQVQGDPTLRGKSTMEDSENKVIAISTFLNEFSPNSRYRTLQGKSNMEIQKTRSSQFRHFEWIQPELKVIEPYGGNRSWRFRKRGHSNFGIFEWIQPEVNVFEPYGGKSTMEIQKTRRSQFRHLFGGQPIVNFSLHSRGWWCLFARRVHQPRGEHSEHRSDDMKKIPAPG